MKAVGLAIFGWLVPGGAYLLMRRYLQFAVFATVAVAQHRNTYAATHRRSRRDRFPSSAMTTESSTATSRV